MTKEEFALPLNGREIGNEINADECAMAKQYGLVVIYGASDDLIELRGAIHDEVGMYDGGVLYIHAGGVSENGDNEECKRCRERMREDQKKAAAIKCEWGKEPFSWHIEPAKIPFAPFEITEDGEKFCRGIVISIADLPKI